MTSKQSAAEHTFGASIDIDGLISAFARHWLAVLNVLSGLFAGLTAVAPLLMKLGLEGPARLLYAFYALIGLATVWLLYPLLHKEFADQ
jgi:hypothetical protein